MQMYLCIYIIQSYNNFLILVVSYIIIIIKENNVLVVLIVSRLNALQYNTLFSFNLISCR